MNKLKTIVAVLAIAGMMGSAVPSAGALTVEELSAQIVALQAQLAALQGQTGTPVTACTFTRSLTDGISGTDVKCLQDYLIAGGYAIPAGATSYYGSQTTAAVAAWQAANGVTPAAGYFGPISQAKYAALTAGTTTPATPTTPAGLPAGCTSTTGYSPTTGEACSATTPTTPAETTGTEEGDLTFKLLGVPSNGTEVYEGEEDVDVMAFNLKAYDSNITVNRIDIRSEGDTVRLSSNLDYVSLYAGTKALVGVDASDFDRPSGQSYYRYRFDGLNLSIAKGETETIYVKVNALSSVDADDYTFTVPTDGIRYTDEAGLTGYLTGDSRDFSMVTDLTGTLTVTKNTDSPEEGIVIVDADAYTEGVELLRFDLQAKVSSVKVDEITVDLTATGTLADAAVDVIRMVYLYDGSTLLGTESLGSTDTSVTFTDLMGDISIAKNAKKTLTVKVDLLKLPDTAAATYAEGDAITAIVNGGSAAKIVAEDANEANTTESGTATSETMYVYLAAPAVSLSSTSMDETLVGGDDADTRNDTARIDGIITFTLTNDGTDEIIINEGGITINGYAASGTATVEAQLVKIDGEDVTGTTAAAVAARTIGSGESVTVTANARITALTPASSEYVYFKIATMTWKRSGETTSQSMTTSILNTLKTDSMVFSY